MQLLLATSGQSSAANVHALQTTLQQPTQHLCYCTSQKFKVYKTKWGLSGQLLVKVLDTGEVAYKWMYVSYLKALKRTETGKFKCRTSNITAPSFL